MKFTAGKSLVLLGLVVLTIVMSPPVHSREQLQEPDAATAARYGVYFEVRVVAPDGNPVRGLDEEDFLVLEEGSRRPVLHFEEKRSIPIVLAGLVDVGSNSSEESVSLGKDLLFKLIHELDPDDEILIVSYDRDVHFLSELTNNRKQLVDAIWNISPTGRLGILQRIPNLFVSNSVTGYAIDEVLHALKGVQQENKILIVVSPGFGGLGKVTADHLHQAGARLFAVGLDNKLGNTFNLGGDQAAKETVVEKSGGMSLPGEQALERVGQISRSLKNCYTIAYEPAQSGKDLLQRELVIQVRDHPEFQVLTAQKATAKSLYF